MVDHKINEIKVPNTFKNDNHIIEIVGISLLIIGIGTLIYGKSKKK